MVDENVRGGLLKWYIEVEIASCGAGPLQEELSQERVLSLGSAMSCLKKKTAHKRDLWPTCNTLLGVTSSKCSGSLVTRVMTLCLEEIYLDVESMDSSTDDSEVTCIVPWGLVP